MCVGGGGGGGWSKLGGLEISELFLQRIQIYKMFFFFFGGGGGGGNSGELEEVNFLTKNPKLIKKKYFSGAGGGG